MLHVFKIGLYFCYGRMWIQWLSGVVDSLVVDNAHVHKYFTCLHNCKKITWHTAHIIISSRYPKEWVMIQTPDLCMIIREHSHIPPQNWDKWVGGIGTAPYIAKKIIEIIYWNTLDIWCLYLLVVSDKICRFYIRVIIVDIETSDMILFK